MTTTQTTTRLAPGEYVVTDGTREVTISRHYWLDARFGQWVASAGWDRYLYTDPVGTLADAKRNAAAMLAEAAGDA